MIEIKRALLSVSDKAGIVELAQTLHSHGCELISTGGTRRVLEKAGLPTTEISRVTGNPEAFGGRMKTISFNVESAILYDRERDRDEADALGIQPIDMVVCNLYPFERYAEQRADTELLVENIDIGGPTMIRAAAKNFRWVTVVTTPDDYTTIREELDREKGSISPETRIRLMYTAFQHTADYDAAIATTMTERFSEPSLRFAFAGGTKLRYGENWHQEGRLYRERGAESSLCDLEVLHGGELSFNNIVDMHSAICAVRTLGDHGCAVIKHNNPCGLSSAQTQRRAFELAWQGDPVSAFGSVVAFKSRVTRDTIEYLELENTDKTKRKFIDLMVAPDYSPDALELLSLHKSLRVVRLDPARIDDQLDIRVMGGACVVQDADNKLMEKLEIVTDRAPETEDRELVEFGLTAVTHVRSNAIVVVRRTNDGSLQLLGMGAGQPNRIQSTRLALERCRENLTTEHQGSPEELDRYILDNLRSAMLISDAFFPFPDSVERCAEEGIGTVVQPGGSIRDKQVIARCNELGVAMMLTGTRHFKH